MLSQGVVHRLGCSRRLKPQCCSDLKLCVVQPITFAPTFSRAHSKLKAQSANVLFHRNFAKETFELPPLSFETAFENVTAAGIGCTKNKHGAAVRLQCCEQSCYVHLIFLWPRNRSPARLGTRMTSLKPGKGGLCRILGFLNILGGADRRCHVSPFAAMRMLAGLSFNCYAHVGRPVLLRPVCMFDTHLLQVDLEAHPFAGDHLLCQGLEAVCISFHRLLQSAGARSAA